MTRHFANIRDDIKNLEENINCIAEKTLEVLEQKNILILNEDIVSNSSKSKIEPMKHKQAHLHALQRLMVFINNFSINSDIIYLENEEINEISHNSFVFLINEEFY